MMDKDISRREFLKGAAYGAVGVAAVGLLGGCAAQAPVPQATDAPAESAPPEAAKPNWGAPEETPHVFTSGLSNVTDYTDVVVIGGGLAGLTAAIQAGESYCAAYLLEKSDRLGGSLASAQGVFGVATTMQQQAGVADLSVKQAFDTLMQREQWSMDALVAGEYVRRSADNIQWLMDKGIRFSSVETVGDSLQTLHRFAQSSEEIVKILTDACNQYGVSVRLGSAVEQIHLSDEGKIIGVTAVDGSGNSFSIECSCVILATGGFADNPTMIKDYADLEETRYCVPEPGNRMGDGMKMGLSIGACAAPRSNTLLALGGMLPHDKIGSELFILSAMEPVLWINELGKRFVDESLNSRDFTACFNAVRDQQRVYAIVPKSYIDTCVNNGCRMGCPMLNIPAGTKLTNLWAEIEQMQASYPEDVFYCETVSDLIQGTGTTLPLDAVTTIRMQDTLFKENIDEEYGKDPKYLVPFAEEPCYVFRLLPAILATPGGLRTTLYACAVDANRNNISGLYAAGNDAGSATGFTCADGMMPGFAQGWAVNSGRLAAKEVAFVLGAGP